jgi:outer membrane receptor protein involved in Fe transport
VSVLGVSGSTARGNENGLHQPDGQFYVGAGSSPAYAVTNLGGRFQATSRVQLFVHVNNLLDRRYYTAAQLGPTGFAAGGAFQARPFPAVDGEFPVQHGTFLAPGAPRIVWGGLRVRF